VLLPQVTDDAPLLSHSVDRVCAREDWETAEDVLDTILGLCNAVVVPEPALYTAAQFSSRNILSKLLLHKKTKDKRLLGELLVSCCCKRHDNNREETVAMATMLMDEHGINPNFAKDRYVALPMELACERGHIALIQALFERGGVLTSATMMHMYRSRGIEDGGVGDVARFGGECPMDDKSGDCNSKRPLAQDMVSADPVQRFRLAARVGVNFENCFSSIAFDDDLLRDSCWALARMAGPRINSNSPDYEFNLVASHPHEEWARLLACEIGTTRHPNTLRTVLHHVACKGSIRGVRAVIGVGLVNPFIPDRRGKLAIELTQDPEIRRLISDYSSFKPTKMFRNWIGPIFCKRARAFLLIASRYSLALNKNIQEKILTYMARNEYTLF
jgi:hypothetical protein